jgi:tetratricopeptide (TPR) repeat protein
MSMNQIMHVLKFTSEELEQNRNGQMSATQRQRVVRGGLAVFVGVFLLSALLGVGLIATWEKPVPSRIYVGLGVFIGVMMWFSLRFYLRARAAAADASVERVTGTVSFALEGRTLWMQVGERRFPVVTTFRQVFRPDVEYHVYYSPRDKNVLSAEPAARAQPAPSQRPDLPSGQQLANQLIEQANQHYAAGDYPEAIRLYREGIAAHPIAPYRGFNLVIGEMLEKMERWDEAIEAYKEVIAAHPEHDQAWQSLAGCYMVTGDEAQALDAAEKAIQFNSEDFRSYYNAAMLYAKRDEHKRARAYLRRALQLAPSWREHALENALLRPYLDDEVWNNFRGG